MDLFEIRNLFSSGKSIYEIPLRVTYYARVSTDRDEQLHSLSAQVGYYSKLIKSNPNWTFVEGYIDEGISGTSVNKREAFLKMIEDAKLGRFDFIITKEISRFSRSTLDSIKYTQELLTAGVGVFFQNDNINTLHADSELRLTIMSSIAQDEVRKLSERVSFGLKRSIENGTVLGNNAIWGYKKDNGKLVIVEREAEIVRQIFHLYANEKLGFRTLAARLSEKGMYNSKGNEFTGSSLRRIIINPKYKGYYCGGKSHKYDYRQKSVNIDSNKWVMYKDENIVPQIVSEELWEKANAIFRQRSESMSADKTSYQNKYTYSGKIMCMEHECSYHHTTHKSDKVATSIWKCKVKRAGKTCNSPIIYTDELDEIMRSVMSNVFIDREKIVNKLIKIYCEISNNSELTTNIAKLKVKLEEINKRKEKLLDLCLDNRMSNEEFQKRNDTLNIEAKDTECQISDYEAQDIQNQEIARQANNIRNLIIKELSFENNSCIEAVGELLERIEVYTNDRNSVSLRIYLKISDTFDEYSVLREKGKPSVVTHKNVDVCTQSAWLEASPRIKSPCS